MRGDLGDSLLSGEPVVDEFAARIGPTVQLAIMAFLLSLLVGVALGALASIGRDLRGVGQSSRIAGALVLSVPDFVLGSLLVYLFSRYALGLTVGGYVPLAEDPAANLRATVLPAVTLSVFGTALFMRTTRDAVLSVMTEKYVTAAVARGLSPRKVARRHIMRNAAPPVMTVAVANAGYLLGGAVVAEVLFSIPGIGGYLLSSIGNRDYSVVQTGVLLATVVFVLLNIFADAAHVMLDPRLRANGGHS